MKYFVYLLLCFFLLNSFCLNDALAQQTSRTARQPHVPVPFTDTKIISFHPFSLIAGSFRMGFETKVSNRNSVKMIAGISLADKSEYYGVDNVFAYYIEAQLRYYIGNATLPNYHVLKGAYAAPFILHKRMDYDAVFDMGTFFRTEAATVNAVGAGIIIGIQAVSTSSLTLDMYAGGGILASYGEYSTISSIAFDPYRKGVIPQLGFNMGFSF